MVIRPGVELPLAEVELRTSRSSGPGRAARERHGLARGGGVRRRRLLACREDCKRRVLRAARPAGDRRRPGHRSQARNRELALERLRDRLDGGAARAPPAPAHPAERRGAAAAAGAEAAQLRAQAGAAGVPTPDGRLSRCPSRCARGFWVAVFLRAGLRGRRRAATCSEIRTTTGSQPRGPRAGA